MCILVLCIILLSKVILKYLFLLFIVIMVIAKEIRKMDGYIDFKVKGVFENSNFNKELLDVFYTIEDSSNRYDCPRVLLDATNLDYNISDIDRFRIGKMIAEIYQKNLIRIACLRCENIINDFTEIVAYNRGAYFKFFKDRDDAIKWLIS